MMLNKTQEYINKFTGENVSVSSIEVVFKGQGQKQNTSTIYVLSNGLRVEQSDFHLCYCRKDSARPSQ